MLRVLNNYWFIFAIVTTWHRWFPENFVKIGCNWLGKIGFENFWKKQVFEKFSQNCWREILLILHFMNSWVPWKAGEVGVDIHKMWKKNKNHCTLIYLYCRLARLVWLVKPCHGLSTMGLMKCLAAAHIFPLLNILIQEFPPVQAGESVFNGGIICIPHWQMG
jgi:hypothetical protein